MPCTQRISPDTPYDPDLPEPRPILIYGGTFDPPHAAHAALPLLVADQLDAAALRYLPAGRSPFKTDHEQSAPHHRLAMLRLMVDALRPTTTIQLDIDTTEIDRGDDTPSYTVDTVRRLHDQFGPDQPMRLLLGTDQFLAFDQWREARTIATLAPPVVMLRPPHGRADVQRFLGQDAPAYLCDAATLVDTPALDVSSTSIRQAIRDGQPQRTNGHLHPAVAAYAHEHGLYAR